MKKRILSILLLQAMVVSLVAPFLPVEAKNLVQTETHEVKIVGNDLVEISTEPEIIETITIEEIAEKRKSERLVEISDIEDKQEWFIAYKEIVNDYDTILDLPETIYDVFTEEEIELICRVVETEAHDQPFEAKCNIANVIFNRWYSNEFGTDIIEIIKTPNQFAYNRFYYTEETLLSVMYAFEICDSTDGALYFHSNKKTSSFNNASYLFTDCAGHHFYK